MEVYYDCEGEKISHSDLSIPKAMDFANCITSSEYVELLGCYKVSEQMESVKFVAQVELGQLKVNDIRNVEILCVQFDAKDKTMPEVLALRKDFPQVPHINQRDTEFPRSLCLYSKGYEELKIDWTSLFFLERIREWLAQTAKGELHKADQPLEPILLSTQGDIVVPKDINDESLLVVRQVDFVGNRMSLVVEEANADAIPSSIGFVALQIKTRPQTHGVIRSRPQTLFDLHELLLEAGTNLLKHIDTKLIAIKERKEHARLLNSRLIIIVELPKTREQEGIVESTERRAFVTEFTALNIGIRLDLWDYIKVINNVGYIHRRDTEKVGKDILIDTLNAMEAFSPKTGQILNGVGIQKSPSICCFGVGALGSHIVLNMARAGYDNWTLIDNDMLYPHNLARHALTGSFVGRQKSRSMACMVNDVFGKNAAKGFTIDFLYSDADTDEYKGAVEAINASDVIIDATTSTAMSRLLSYGIEHSARRISAFLNPSGSSLVMLAEDRERKHRLDEIEMQYYRTLALEQELNEHLKTQDGDIRYANTCKDVSSRLPQNSIALHSAIAANAISQVIPIVQGKIQIWKNDFKNQCLRSFEYECSDFYALKENGWTIKYDSHFLNKVHSARIAKLPNETGGILIGSYDMDKKVVYVLDAILSPMDSVEYPTVYIRGHKKLRKKVEEVEKITLGRLTYVGEWHSHPDGCTCEASFMDRVAFNSQKKEMEKSGYPTMMAIVGQNDKMNCYIAEID
ncbi:MAG: ThiF family adenylyltransferase [Chitinispirillaceae bacterium]